MNQKRLANIGTEYFHSCNPGAGSVHCGVAAGQTSLFYEAMPTDPPTNVCEWCDGLLISDNAWRTLCCV